MAALYSLKVITPEKTFFDGETSQIIARTSEGDVGILANHISLVADLPSGPLKIKYEDGTWKTAAVSSGIMKVGSNKVSIFANAVEWADEIDVDRAKLAREAAEDRMKKLKSKQELDIAELKLKRALNRISVHDMYGK